ncbi:MAG TPA: DUF4214 domain-containing protein [Pirellulales bacterium]
MRTRCMLKQVSANHRLSPSNRRLRLEPLEDRSLLTASVLSADVGIGPPIDPTELSNVKTSVDNQTSSVAMAPNGDFVVAWDNDDLSSGNSINETIYARPYFADGQPKSAPIEVATNSPPTISDTAKPRVSMAGDGSFVVAWNVWHDTSPNQVAFRRFAADGTAEDASQVLVDSSDSENGVSQVGADVASYGNDNFVVVWTHYVYNAPGSTVYMRLFNAAGAASSDSELVDAGSNPHVAAHQNAGQPADIVVTGESVFSGTSYIWATPFENTSTASTSGFQVTTMVGTNNDSTVAMNASGDFVVGWQNATSVSRREVYARRYTYDFNDFQDKGAKPLDPLPIEVTFSDVDASDFNPDVALADDDSLAITWDNYSTQRNYYALYVPSGSVIPFSSGEIDAGYDSGFAPDAAAGRAAVAMNGAGRFVVSWQQDPSGGFPGINQVQVLRFHADIPPVANNDVYVLSSSATSVVSPANSMIVNDSDFWGDAPQAGLVTKPSLGTLTQVHQAGPLGGTFAYTKGPNFQYTDSFTYQDYDSDSNGPSNTATVTLLSQPAAVVYKFYESVLNRVPEAAGLQYWATQLASGRTTGNLAVGFFESDELLNQIIGGYYTHFLLRPADAAGLAYWKGVWHATGGPEQIKADFASSPEFYNSVGGTPGAWINALYNRVLGRAPDPAGDSYWLNYYQQHLAAGQSAGAIQWNIALDFLDSPEAFADDVAGWFHEYLLRAPSAAESNQYSSEMVAGASDRTIEQQITNLPEYAATPTAPAGTAILLPNYFNRS